MSIVDTSDHDLSHDIAIIGMAGAFPGAPNIEAFWENIRDGVESIRFFSDQELLDAGVDPALLAQSAYVKARPILENIEYFDAAFFDYTPREAEIMDPQHRFLLECAWEALESAGYNPEIYPGRIGVYAGTGENTYLWYNLVSRRALIETLGGFQTILANGKDYLATRISYKLNLHGPSLTVQTACSTSLVALHLACQSLLSGESDMALAGAVSITLPHIAGYLYQEEGITSPDGHCRAFDAHAQGTIFGHGLGMVVVKRLTDALADGDYIHAVIKGSAINNDGSQKVGFTAPSVDGQVEAIAEAQAVAGISADTIHYVETHGTGTRLGDPIEITALTQAFRLTTERKCFCAIGSVKTNIGHVNTAAGMAGLIKTVMALKHKQIPPSLHFELPNPQIDFANSPFYVNTQLREWKTDTTPRRAAVSSFGLGGTNSHVVVEEAPQLEPGTRPAHPWQVIVLSARTERALRQMRLNLLGYLQQHPDLELADIAYTLQVGRQPFSHRNVMVCRDVADAIQVLDSADPTRIFSAVEESSTRSVVFMFPGQGSQYMRMGQELYQTEPIFRTEVDLCAELLIPHLGLDLRSVLYSREESASTKAQLNQTWLTQPALFVLEYALAKLWLAWGVRPAALIGHSIGEYVSACLAGVFSLDEALRLIAIRGRLMQQLPGGSMLAVPFAEQIVQPWLNERLSLAAVNAPEQCVVAGSAEAVSELEQRLLESDVACRRLVTSHAFHSAMMETIRENFVDVVRTVALHPPEIPYLSNVTGTWITAQQATDPAYWAQHMCTTVRFSDGMRELLKQPRRILLEVGPGQTLGSFARQQFASFGEHAVLPSLRHALDTQSDVTVLLQTLGRLWLAGVAINWSDFYRHERRQRLPLPTYPFERKYYWIKPEQQPAAPQAAQVNTAEALAEPGKENNESEGLYHRPATASPYIAPRNEQERALAAIYQQLLGVAPIGIHDSFFELGGHSLLAVQFVSQIRRQFNVRLPLGSFFQTPTIADLAEVIAMLSRGETPLQLTAHPVDEAVLDPAITGAEAPRVPPGQLAHVLLTGATGFLGAFMLHELFEQTQANIYCLVRAPDVEAAWQRLRKQLTGYGVWDERLRTRVIPVPADLAKPMLGLASSEFHALASTIDVVYHNAAWVNWIYPYATLKDTNVLGTQEVLRLASLVRVKPVHYISSTAVFDILTYAQTEVPDEDLALDVLDYSRGLQTGYAQSKWVAEKLTRLACARGIPVAVYRPSYVAGHSQTGACNTRDYLFRMAKGCIQLGLVPDVNMRVNIAPVDFVSKAIIYLSLQPGSLERKFHILNPAWVYWQDIIDWIQGFGYPLQRVGYSQWLAKISSQTDNALYPLLPYLPDEEHSSGSNKIQGRLIDCQKTLQALAGSSVVCPEVDDKLLSAYFNYMLDSKFIEVPQ